MIEYTDPIFRGLNLRKLKVDEAYVNATTKLKHNFYLYSLSAECDKCPYTRQQEIAFRKGGNVFKIDVTRRVSWKIFDKDVGNYAFSNVTSMCDFDPHFGEFGVYDLEIKDDRQCSLTTAKEPVNIYLPILTVILIVTALTALGVFIKCGYKKAKQRKNENQAESSQDLPTNIATSSAISDKHFEETQKSVKKRLKSLDTFRGIAIILMIFVNSGGGHYWWIEHATWNGLHIADLVFPWFLFIMGVCIPISIKSQFNKNIRRRDIVFNIFKRSLKLFLIGLCLNTINGAQLETIRIFGVLQRFGIAYFVVSTIHVCFSQQITMQPQNRVARSIFDILVLLKHWALMIIILAIYLCFVFLLHVPGCPDGYLGPGGKHEMVKQVNCTGGVTGYLDRLILGNSHIYQHPTARYVYDAKPFDPEGIFGCLPTIFQVFLGLQCGMIIVIHTESKSRLKRWLIWGLVLGLFAGLLCGFSKNDGFMPVNKNLWSLSYVFATSSLAFFLLSFCYFLIDVKRIWSGEPFIYPGMNAIIMYVGHTVFHKMLPWHWRIGPMNTHFMLLLEDLWNAVLWNLVAYYLYLRGVFYSI